SLFETQPGAPIIIGGIPDPERRVVQFGVEIPRLLSLLAHHDPDAVVIGLDSIPREEWPPLAIVHVSFQVMVGLGTCMALVSLLAGWFAFRKGGVVARRWLLKALVLAAPMGFLATEAGWLVTEVGRQPWIIHGIMKTRDAVTPMPGLVVPLMGFTVLYFFLAVVVIWLLYRQIVRSPQTSEATADA
ncbi:MAG: cytochrome ubiquinol oxidase subunit I, partial [Gemmatimonadota bacterium]